PPSVVDPFKDEQRYRLPPRTETPAGKLEELAGKQDQQDAENSNSPDRSPQQKSAAAKQAELAGQMNDLASAAKLSPAAQKAAERAARDAQKAAEQLKQSDSAAARSPSAGAAQALKDGVAAQEASGRATALTQLDAARRALNEAAPLPDATDRA